MMKFKTHYSGTLIDGHGLYEMGPWKSQTVPDMTMSIRDMLARHQQGLSFGDVKIPMYESDDPELASITPLDWDKMDLSEKEDFVNELTARVKKAKDDVLTKQNKDRIEKLRAQEREKLEKELRKEQQPAPPAPKPPVP